MNAAGAGGPVSGSTRSVFPRHDFEAEASGTRTQAMTVARAAMEALQAVDDSNASPNSALAAARLPLAEAQVRAEAAPPALAFATASRHSSLHGSVQLDSPGALQLSGVEQRQSLPALHARHTEASERREAARKQVRAPPLRSAVVAVRATTGVARL